MTTITVTTNSGTNTPGSLLAAIQTAAISPQPVLINFDDSVTQIDLTIGSNIIGADDITINGNIATGRVLIRNINSTVGAASLFSNSGTVGTPKTGFHLIGLEMTAFNPPETCQFFSVNDVSSFTVDDCFFHDNTNIIISDGGVLAVARCTINFLNSVFSGNNGNDGGVCLLTSCDGAMVSCQFLGNASTNNSGAIRKAAGGNLTCTLCTFIGNTAGANGAGGAINILSGIVNFTGCTFQNNSTNGLGGAIACSSGDLFTIDQCLFEGNSASIGGAIMSNTSPLAISLTTIQNNTSTNVISLGFFGGGGIFMTGNTMQLISSLIQGNTSTAGGGGISIELLGIGQNLFFNSTIYGNSVTGLTGGGIRQYTAGGGAITMTNCTIAANSSVVDGGGIFTLAGLISAGNNIIATNTSPTNPDISGSVISQGTNLVGIAVPLNGFGGTDLTGTAVTPLDPQIGPLADNGGIAVPPGSVVSTLSVALLPLSPAVDAGNVALLPAIPLAAFDQRGEAPFVRTSDDQPGPLIDIGSFELQQVVICFRKGSQVLVKDTATGIAHTIDIAHVNSSKHTIYDVVTDSFVPIIYNAVGAKNTEFYRLKSNLFGENIPSTDLDVTGPHLILQNGQRTPAQDIPGAVRIETDHELVYSICTAGESTILVNNTEVIAWDSTKWDTYTSKRHISWANNKP